MRVQDFSRRDDAVQVVRPHPSLACVVAIGHYVRCGDRKNAAICKESGHIEGGRCKDSGHV